MVAKSIADGYDVRGMYYWTLMDNIEWHEGFHMKFGLYEWDPVLQRSQVWRTGERVCEVWAIQVGPHISTFRMQSTGI